MAEAEAKEDVAEVRVAAVVVGTAATVAAANARRG